MAILATLFASLGRYVGRILTMALGWASVMLFGRVPQSKQLLLSIISFGSLAWVVVLLGIFVPDVFGILAGFVKIPEFVKPYVSLILIVAAILLPLIIGALSYVMLEASDRPRGKGVVVQIVRGYLYTPVLAFTLAFLAVVAPLRKLRSIIKRWTEAHIPVVVKPGGYEQVARDLEDALDRAELAVDRRRAPRVLEVPAKLLGAVAGSSVKRLVPDHLVVFGGEGIEVLVYPSDISVAGGKQQLARARAAVASRLTFTAAYLTSTKEAQQIEDKLSALVASAPGVRAVAQVTGPSEASVARYREGDVRPEGAATGDDGAPAGADVAAPEGIPSGAVADPDRTLAEIDDELAHVSEIPYEEWEVLYRLRLQVERDLLAARDEVDRGNLPEWSVGRRSDRASDPGLLENAAARLMGVTEAIVAKTPAPRLFDALSRQIPEREEPAEFSSAGDDFSS